MTPRSLFVLLIKIMGLYLLLASISVLPQLVTTLYMFSDPGGQIDAFGITITVVAVLLFFGVLIVTTRYCLFKTDWLIDKLSLDKHFTEEKFELNLHRSTILKIAVIVLGGLMFVDSLPGFVRQFYLYIGQKQTFGRLGENPIMGWLLYEGVKVVISFFLITNSRLVINIIERQRKK